MVNLVRTGSAAAVGGGINAVIQDPTQRINAMVAVALASGIATAFTSAGNLHEAAEGSFDGSLALTVSNVAVAFHGLA